MRFVQLRSFDNYIPAHIMLQRLEGEGIRAYLKDEHTVTIDPILSNAVGGIKLMVYSDQWDRARRLAEEYEKTYRESLPCKHCNSLNVEYISRPYNSTNWFTAILIWLFGKNSMSLKKVYHCYDCGHEFGG